MRSGQYADGATAYVGQQHLGHGENNPRLDGLKPAEILAVKVVAAEVMIYATRRIESDRLRGFVHFVVGSVGWFYAVSNVSLEF